MANSPSLQPSPMIQSAVLVAATITITVMKQQVKAITYDIKFSITPDMRPKQMREELTDHTKSVSEQ